MLHSCMEKTDKEGLHLNQKMEGNETSEFEAGINVDFWSFPTSDFEKETGQRMASIWLGFKQHLFKNHLYF